MNGGLLSALFVGQREIVAEGAVDEFGAGVGIEQHDADVDLIECRRQPHRGGVVFLLGCKRLDPFLSQQTGDDGGAGRGAASIISRTRSAMS